MTNSDDEKGGAMSTFLTIRETAELLRFNHQYVQALCREGKLPAQKVRSRWRIRREELLEQLRLEGRG